MPFLLLAAVLALTPAEAADVRCVAVVGIAARADPALVDSGREFAARVGAEVMDTAKASREDVGDAFLAEGQRVIKVPPDRGEIDQCIARMVERLSR